MTNKHGLLNRSLAFGVNFVDDAPSFFTLMLLSNGTLPAPDLSDEFDYSNYLTWWKKYKLSNIDDGVHYYSLTVNKETDDSFSQSFYLDGDRLFHGILNKNLMNELLIKQNHFMDIGAIESGYNGNQYQYKVEHMANLSKLNVKCLRLYNRGLTDTEVKANYDQTTYYHNKVMGKELK